jgi:hypothetical protein
MIYFELFNRIKPNRDQVNWDPVDNSVILLGSDMLDDTWGGWCGIIRVTPDWTEDVDLFFFTTGSRSICKGLK